MAAEAPPAAAPPASTDVQPAAAVAQLPAFSPDDNNNAQLQVAKSVSTEPLLGGAIGFGVSVRNTSNEGVLEKNKAYNVTVSDTLPAEVTFASASPAPSRVVRNPNGTTTIYWINVTDLDEGQSTSFSIQATIKPTVTVGMPIVNRAGGEANTVPDNSGVYVRASAVATGTAQPIDIEKAIQQSTSVNQATGASGWESTAPGTGAGAQWPYRYELTVKNNNVGATANVQVTDTLAAGVAFLGPTTISPNPNGVSTVPTMIVLADGRLQLVWNLGILTTAQYTTPIAIKFPVAIPYRQRVGTYPCSGTLIPNSGSPTDPGCFDGAIIADGRVYSNTYDALGIFNGSPAGDGSTYTPQDDSPVNVTAKYQTIAKVGDARESSATTTSSPTRCAGTCPNTIPSPTMSSPMCCRMASTTSPAPPR